MKRTRAGRRSKPSPSTRATWTRPRTTRSKVSGACSGSPRGRRRRRSRIGDDGDPHVGTRLGPGAAVLVLAGDVRREQGQLAEAQRFYRWVSQSQSMFVPAMLRLGEMALDRGDGAGGRVLYDLAITATESGYSDQDFDRRETCGCSPRSPTTTADRDADAGPEGAGRRTGLHDRDGRVHGRTRRLPGGRRVRIPATPPTG